MKKAGCRWADARRLTLANANARRRRRFTEQMRQDALNLNPT
jgi:hypothetical protein